MSFAFDKQNVDSSEGLSDSDSRSPVGSLQRTQPIGSECIYIAGQEHLIGGVLFPLSVAARCGGDD